MVVDSKPSILLRCQWALNLIFHQAFAVITVIILWTILKNYDLNFKSAYPWHMFFTTIAYVPLMGEAIILFASDNLWTLKVNRTTRYWLHGCLLMVSGVLATIGIALEINHKTRGHFKTIHAWSGLVSWIFVLLSQILGIAAAKTQVFSKFLRPVYVKLVHNIFGLLGYIFGVVSLCYGLHDYLKFFNPDGINVTIYVLGFATGWSVLAALKSAYSQIKSIFN